MHTRTIVHTARPFHVEMGGGGATDILRPKNYKTIRARVIFVPKLPLSIGPPTWRTRVACSTFATLSLGDVCVPLGYTSKSVQIISSTKCWWYRTSRNMSRSEK